MARLADLKLKYRLYMRAYPYRHLDWGPGAQLRNPLAKSKIAVVTSAAFYGGGQEPFDPEMRGGDYSYREIPQDVALETLKIGHKSDAFDHAGIEKDKNLALPLALRGPSVLTRSILGGSNDITQAAFARGILHFAGAIARLHLRLNLLGNCRTTCLGDLVLNVTSCEPKAVANRNGFRCLFGADSYH